MADNTFLVGGVPNPLTTLMDFVSGDQPIYIGEATPGTVTSAAKWRIQKRAYSNRRLISIKWADGNGNFDNVYDDRDTLTYS